MFDKWKNCVYSVAFGDTGEDVDAVCEANPGFIQNFGCLCPAVIQVAVVKSSFYENGDNIPAAILCGFGKPTDPNIREALTKSCGDCLYFQEQI